MVTGKILTIKLIVLLLLLEVPKFNTYCVFVVGNVALRNMWANFLPNKVIKQSRKGRPLGKDEYKAYLEKINMMSIFHGGM